MQPHSDLQTVLRFTSDDLNDNREGKLSPGQIERLQSQVRASRTNYIRFIVILVVVGGFIGFRIDDASHLGWFILGLTLFVSVLLLIYVLYRSQRSLSAGTVQMQHGK